MISPSKCALLLLVLLASPLLLVLLSELGLLALSGVPGGALPAIFVAFFLYVAVQND